MRKLTAMSTSDSGDRRRAEFTRVFLGSVRMHGKGRCLHSDRGRCESS
jgi:hypothetical protein